MEQTVNTQDKIAQLEAELADIKHAYEFSIKNQRRLAIMAGIVAVGSIATTALLAYMD